MSANVIQRFQNSLRNWWWSRQDITFRLIAIFIGKILDSNMFTLWRNPTEITLNVANSITRSGTMNSISDIVSILKTIGTYIGSIVDYFGVSIISGNKTKTSYCSTMGIRIEWKPVESGGCWSNSNQGTEDGLKSFVLLETPKGYLGNFGEKLTNFIIFIESEYFNRDSLKRNCYWLKQYLQFLYDFLLKIKF